SSAPSCSTSSREPAPGETALMKSALRNALLASVIVLAVPLAAEAHRAWILPSATVLSGDDLWITVDAAVSNDLFYFNHRPLQLDGLHVTAPDGTELELQNASVGEIRSTFDVHLTKPGTYKLWMASDFLFA